MTSSRNNKTGFPNDCGGVIKTPEVVVVVWCECLSVMSKPAQ